MKGFKRPLRKLTYQFADYDYLDILNPEQLKALEIFTRNYYQHNDPDAEDYKESCDRENAARRDIWNKHYRKDGDQNG